MVLCLSFLGPLFTPVAYHDPLLFAELLGHYQIQGKSKVRRSRYYSGFASILSLHLRKPLILRAKGSGFGSHALESAKKGARRGCGLGGQVRPGAPVERGRVDAMPG